MTSRTVQHPLAIDGVKQVNRVPEVTPEFWAIKVLAVTMGETAADYLAMNLGLGLTVTSIIMTGVLVLFLAVQYANRRYVPWTYWSVVVMISIVGTLVTDNLVDNFGVALETTTIIFSLALLAVFAAWYASERTLSIHTIFTARRESWYWLAVLLTFALGTSAGDLVAEKFEFGYLTTGLIFGAVVAGAAFAYYVLRLNPILAFWIAYIFTRPLGASFGDLLSQPMEYGGLGLGTMVTSLVFLVSIAALVIHLTFKGQLTPDGVVADEGLPKRPIMFP